MGSVVIPHLVTGWHVDQAIMSEEDRLVVIRFGRDWDPDCMRQDEVLYKIADRVKNFAVIYVCDIDQVPDFKQMYELYDTVTLMFFFRNKHMMCDFGTGNNNKLNWVLEDKQELIDIVETIYKGAKKGRGLVVPVLSGRDESYRRVVRISGLVGTPRLRICKASAQRTVEHFIDDQGEVAATGRL
ncbi:Thioredoxin-like 4A [Friedmanniomyces endolithicus]|uniref:Thioredoxin-like 4A n=1 Tax=Friedmanniomyces endolithicus TaxID=329885 RepID=A0AAN6JZS0_9PEZI|nr:Thioredoxin-like 4A [Friedmanniomyces endolithicus]KAK0786975.1 Thioredoxin-like 4A [Friedmanniomyces endolithicus]KAK0841167.1 Thioredoxin-like 4A [Friedmanniomyces endolithicus]KAK0848259.1 Thioredoxin-like 4A [Friedmanniomyces endolithicus]KAK0907897.1 Thioredoxin-like 4A [Friedmanniomyces endolithicus]